MLNLVGRNTMWIAATCALIMSAGSGCAEPAKAAGAQLDSNPREIVGGQLVDTMRAAQAGDANAQNQIGDEYCSLYHRVLPLDYREAMKWYQLSSQQGNADATLKIGQLYDYGLGVKRDIVAAFEYYKKAAAQGYPEAQYWTGKDYLEGHGVAQNHQFAIDYLNSSAKQGHMPSQALLAYVYMNKRGPGVEYCYDPSPAYSWLSLAVASGNGYSKDAVEHLSSVSHTMNLLELVDAQARALAPQTAIIGPPLPTSDQLLNSRLPKP